MNQPDPTIWDDPEIRRFLAVRDVAGIFGLLQRREISQRHVAELAGMSQSEVSEILHGSREVHAYSVLVRICEGLGIPRGLMGLAYDEETETSLAEEVDEDMKRRALMAAGTIALFGKPVLGEVLHIPVRPQTPTPLPSRLMATDVTAIRSLTESLRTVARTYGGGADMITGVAARSLSLMSVPAADDVQTAMASALANLHTMAGWTCVDSGFYDEARTCFATAMELAKTGNDNREMALAFRHAGIQMGEAGAYADALKAFQLGLISADDPETIAWLHGETAWSYALMGRQDRALTAISKAREQSLADPFEAAEMDYVSACVHWKLDRLDTAQALAVSSVRKWEAEGVSRRDSVEADILLATLHATTGQPDTVALTQQAIVGVAGLRSVRARQVKLPALAQALESQPQRPEFTDLAVHARRVMTTIRQPSSQV
ncbi:MAG: helix-turn-helix domain-containing protein [Pseudonocardiaceae bacterium]